MSILKGRKQKIAAKLMQRSSSSRNCENKKWLDNEGVYTFSGDKLSDIESVCGRLQNNCLLFENLLCIQEWDLRMVLSAVCNHVTIGKQVD